MIIFGIPTGVVSWLGWEVHTLADFTFHSLNLHNVVYMYIMYTYLLTYKLTYILLMQVRTNVFLDTLWCKCQCNVTLHVGSFTTSKKGVKTLLFSQTFYELFSIFLDFLCIIFSQIFSLYVISNFRALFLHSLKRLKVALVLFSNNHYH